MSTAHPNVSVGLPPFFRRYDLPWSPSEETERRFRVIFRNCAIVFLVIAVIIPFLPTPERVSNTDSLPERVVQLVIEPPKPPPPPPPAEAGEGACRREADPGRQARGSAPEGLQERSARVPR